MNSVLTLKLKLPSFRDRISSEYLHNYIEDDLAQRATVLNDTLSGLSIVKITRAAAISAVPFGYGNFLWLKFQLNGSIGDITQQQILNDIIKFMSTKYAYEITGSYYAFATNDQLPSGVWLPGEAEKHPGFLERIQMGINDTATTLKYGLGGALVVGGLYALSQVLKEYNNLKEDNE